MQKCICLITTFFLVMGVHAQQAVQHISISAENSSYSDIHGNPVKMTEYHGTSPDTFTKYSSVQFENGRIISEKMFNPDGTEKSSTTRTYTQDGKLSRISGVDPAGNIKWSYSYVYNAAGNLIEEISLDAENNIEWRAVYEYAENGLVSSRKTLTKDNKVSLIEQFTYTQTGKTDEYFSKYGDNKILKRIKYSYDENDSLAKEFRSDGNGLYETVSYTYSSGNISVINRYDAAGTLKDTEYRDYQDGRLVHSVIRNANGSLSGVRKFLYDWKGNRVFEQNEAEMIFRNYIYQDN